MSWQNVINGGPASAALLGAELEPYPYISGYGLLRRMTQLGRLVGVELTAIGIRNRVATDVLAATQRPGAVKNHLLLAVGLQATRVGDYWSPEVWSPLATRRALEGQRLPLRDCPLCAAHGYHCVLFQLPSIDRCPWHDAKLYANCPKCGKTCWAAFNEDLRLGRCTCGYDAFQARIASVDMWQFPTAQADEWSGDYLSWTAKQRKARLLAIPALDTEWMPGYAVLARSSPDPLPQVDKPSIEIEVFSEEGDDPPEGEFWGWSLLGGERLLTFVPLPVTMHAKLVQATRDAIAAFPANSPTPLQLATMSVLEEGETLEQNFVNRPECLIAPHGLSGERGTWLNVSAVDPVAAWFCGQLMDVAVSALPMPDDGVSRSLQAARSCALDHIVGRRHLARALEAILTRAYAQGLERVLRSMIRCRAGSQPQKWHLPTAEIVIRDGQLNAVKLCWTATTPPAYKRAMDLYGSVSAGPKTKTRKSRRKRRRRYGRRTAATGKPRQKE